VSFAARVYAEPPRQEVVHAYVLLKHANHNYEGHRARALEHLQSAGKALNLKLEGDADNRERQAILRALPFLPSQERFVPLAADATRSNVLPVFEALACENPFPAEHLPEQNFNQLVMKALFNGVKLSRIRGLGWRVGPELSRMAGDYAAERRAAGRPVPADIDLVLLGTPTL